MTMENDFELQIERGRFKQEYGNQDNSKLLAPYSLSPNQMETYFGFKAKTIYDLMYAGRLHRGYHYLKVGKKVVIVCDKFIEWMEENDGSQN